MDPSAPQKTPLPETNNIPTPPNMPPQPTTALPEFEESSSQPWSPLPAKPSRSRKTLYIVLGLVLTLLCVGAATATYVFAYYLPNRPENVYQAALVNSARGVDSMEHYLTNDQTGLLTKSGAAIKGNFAYKSEDLAVDGSLTSRFNDGNSTTTLKAGVNGARFQADILTEAERPTATPDIYFKIDGITGLSALLGTGQNFDALNNRWIFVDHTLLDNLTSQAEEAKDRPAVPTKEQYKSGVTAAARVTKEYIFTSDKSKSMVTMRSFVGKTTEKGHALNRYKVSVNKAHAKAYFAALGSELDASAFGQWYEKAMEEKLSQSTTMKEARDWADKIDEARTYDLYVDTKTKVIYKLHVDSAGEETPGWFEISLDAKDDKILPFSFVMHTSEKTSEGRPNDVVDMTLYETFDATTGIARADFDFKATGDAAMTATGTMTYTPSDEKVVITKPAAPMGIMEALQMLGF